MRENDWKGEERKLCLARKTLYHNKEGDREDTTNTKKIGRNGGREWEEREWIESKKNPKFLKRCPHLCSKYSHYGKLKNVLIDHNFQWQLFQVLSVGTSLTPGSVCLCTEHLEDRLSHMVVDWKCREICDNLREDTWWHRPPRQLCRQSELCSSQPPFEKVKLQLFILASIQIKSHVKHLQGLGNQKVQ